MNTYLPSTLLLTLALLSTPEGVAQSSTFARNRVLDLLDDGSVPNHDLSGSSMQGERAAAVITAGTSGEVDLIISTHPDLGAVSFTVTNTTGDRIAAGATRGEATRLTVPVEAEQDLIVHIHSTSNVGSYVPLGFVKMDGLPEVPNEMDILTRE